MGYTASEKHGVQDNQMGALSPKLIKISADNFRKGKSRGLALLAVVL